MPSTGKTPAAISVDFTGVSIGGTRFDRVPEGEYLLEVMNCTQESKKDDPESKYLQWTLRSVKGPKVGAKIGHITSLRSTALWNLRGFLSDLLGEDKVPGSKLNVPLQKIVAAKLKIGASVVDDEPYNNKIKSKIAGTYPAAEFQEIAAAAATTVAPPPDELDEDETSSTAEDIDEIDTDDL